MENLTGILGLGLTAIVGIILTILVRSLVKMYERLWINNEKTRTNPEEFAGILQDALNKVLALQEDRLRKRLERKSKSLEDNLNAPVSPDAETSPEFDTKIGALFDKIKSLQ